MNSVVINQYKRRNFIDEASLSVPKDFEIVAVTDFEYKECNINVVLNDSAVGTRYKAGLQKSSGDFIYLLDDDDLFISRPPYPCDSAVTKIGNRNPTERDIIRFHLDWHISQYCLRKDFAQSLPIAGIKDSLDKVIFFHALGSGISFNPTQYVHKRKHRNSKMALVDRRRFYQSTASIFLDLLKRPMNEAQKRYALYNYHLNLFLSGDRTAFSAIREFIPFSRRMYYSMRRTR